MLDATFAWLLWQRAAGLVLMLVLASLPAAALVTWLLYLTGEPASATADSAALPESKPVAPGEQARLSEPVIESGPSDWSAMPEDMAASSPSRRLGSVLSTAGSVALALLAQVLLLRTRQPLPAVPLFVAAGLAAAYAGRCWPRLPVQGVNPLPGPVGRVWKYLAGVAVLANAAALVFFGRAVRPNVAWLLFVLSLILIGATAWLAAGKPRPRVQWRTELPDLVALAAIFVTAVVVRLIWLDRIPFGVWFDEAFSSLQVERILADPNFRPVFFGDQTQAPALFWYMAVPFFKLFGPVPLAMRLVNAIGGSVGVIALYLAGRELYGRKVGLIAAAILATLTWHINFSRFVPNPAVWSVSLDALALFLLARGLRRGSWLTLALSGIALGLGQYMYYTSRVMIFVLALLFAVVWLIHSRKLVTALQAFVPVAFAGFACASPLIEFAYQHPVEFSARSAAVSIFNEVRQKHSYQPVLDNLRAHLLMFNFQGDPNARHNLPGSPELNAILAGLAVLGLCITVVRIRRPSYLVLAAWAAAMLVGGVFTLSFEAPQSMRSIGETNVMALMAALPLALLWQFLEGLRPGRALSAQAFAGLAAAPVVGLVAASGYIDVNRYFNVEMHDSRSFDEYSTVETFVARGANALPRSTSIYISPTLAGTPTIRFLSPWLKDQKPFNDALLPLREAVDTALFITEDQPVQLIRHLYPKAAIKEVTAPYGGPVILHEVLINATDIDAIQGVQAHYSPASGAAFDRKEAAFELPSGDLPVSAVTAALDSTLLAPAFGDYIFKLDGPADARLRIDREQVGVAGQSIQIKLARGNHKLEVDASLSPSSEGLRLLWRPPGSTDLAPIPHDALFVDPVANNGLLGSYYGNVNWSPPVAIEQIDPFVAFTFHVSPLPYPYSIEWRGQLAVPVAGLYHFGTTSIDSSQVFVDNQSVVDNKVPNAYSDGQAPLTVGLHDIRVRFEAHTGHNHIELYWQPPGRAREIIPTSFLFPSQASGQAVPLPALPAPAASPPPSPPPRAPVGASLDATIIGPAWQVDLAGVAGSDSRPDGVSVDSQGNIYVADAGHPSVEKLDQAGRLLWITGQNDSAVKFIEPTAVAVAADGSVLVLDAGDGFISRLDASGTLRDRFGGPELGLFRPRGMAVGPNGDIYIADTGLGRVVRLGPDGKQAGVIGHRGADFGALREPSGVAVTPDGVVLVADPPQAKIVQFAASGAPEGEWSFSQGEAVDGAQLALGPGGQVWVTDRTSGQVLKYNPDGKLDGAFAAQAGLSVPSGIAVTGNYLIVGEAAGRRIDKLQLPS